MEAEERGGGLTISWSAYGAGGGGGDSDGSGPSNGAGGGGGGSYLASDSTNQLLTVGNNNDGAVYIYGSSSFSVGGA